MPLRRTRHFIWAQRHFFALAVLLVVLFGVWSIVNRESIADYLGNYERRNEMRREVARLEAEAADLERERSKLEQGGFETEKVARERFRFSKPGEEVLYLDPVPTPSPSGR